MLGRFEQNLKNIYHYFQAQWWRARYGWPDRQLQVYGVTGTDGKTTTSLVLGSVLRAAYGRERVGVLSTEVFWFGEDEEANETHMTSTDARVVFGHLRRMVDGGVTHVVVELTSHALDQHRLAGLRLAGAIWLNLHQEHLDYHGTMEAYARAKAKIVRYLEKGAVLVAHGDNEWIRQALAGVQRDGRIEWFMPAEAATVQTPLSGAFNKENVLAVQRLAQAVGISPEATAEGVAAMRQVPGRVEWLMVPDGGRVLIDFALTPGGLERLYTYVREAVSGRVIAVLGAAGRRDRGKRPKQTAVVAQFADEIVLTQDEPYDEPEEGIYRDLERGLVEAKIPWQRIEDRREALAYGLEQLGSDDALVVTGMGNYPFRVVGEERVPWNDKAVVLELMAERDSDE